MSIRLLAIELYKAQQKVHTLQDQFEQASRGSRDKIRNELRVAEAELNQLRRMMDGEKEPSAFSTNSFKR